MVTGLPSRPVRAEILTPSARIVGTVQVSNSGMIGLMNDRTSSLIEVREASMANIDQPKKLVDRFRDMRVVKSQVFAVVLGRVDDVGPIAWARGGYGDQRDYQLRIISSVYQLEGTFKWSQRFDLHAIMVEGTRDFLPLFDVQIRAALLPNLRFECSAMLFNRCQVDGLALIHTPTGDLKSE